MPKVHAFEYFYDAPETVMVEARSLDSYLDGEKFTLVFMDIEGSEYFALKGMQDILRNAKTLFIEYLPHHLKNVSGVTPREFLAQIEPHFDKLFIPSKNIRVEKSQFLSALQAMFDRDQGDDGLILREGLIGAKRICAQIRPEAVLSHAWVVRHRARAPAPCASRSARLRPANR